MLGQRILALLLEELADLTGCAGRKVGCVLARTCRPSQKVGGGSLVDPDRTDLDAIEYLAMVKARARLVAIRKARAERLLPVGAKNTQITERKILQILRGLAEVESRNSMGRVLSSAMNRSPPQCATARSNGTRATK